MTRQELKDVLDRVLTWPPQRQADAAVILKSIEEQDASSYRLSEKQVEEVRRRRETPGGRNLPFEEVFKRFRSAEE